ncbi:MAG: KilA-N domain-containing protein [Prevotella sp.]|nr:KilA-N domain-containing protein [Prevotella sp.]
MTTTKKINANGTEISVLLQGNENDYICLTDIARFKDNQRTDYIIQNWMRARNTIEYLGVWEQLHNPNFNPIEFDGFRNQSGLNSFSLTPKELDWHV